MFTLSKKEFSDELRVIEKVPTANENRKQFYPDDYYLIAESNPNIYKCIDTMDNSKKIEFEIKIDNQLINNLSIVNEDYIKNKILKRSLFKQGIEIINKRIYMIKKFIYGVIYSNETEELPITSFSIDINSSYELLAILLNHNTLIIYNIFRNGNYTF